MTQQSQALDEMALAEAAQTVDPSAIFGLTWQECLERAEATVSAYLAALGGTPAKQGEADADAIVTSLYRRFKDWSKKGFGPDDVTWCEVKAEINSLIALSQHPVAAAVKPLDESKTQGWRDDKGRFCLPMSDGYYVKFPPEAGGLFMIWYYQEPVGGYDTMEAARQAAQEHHEKRIRSALYASPVPAKADGGVTEAMVQECASEGCSKPATVHFVRHDVGSYYCRECYLRIQAIPALQQDQRP